MLRFPALLQRCFLITIIMILLAVAPNVTAVSGQTEEPTAHEQPIYLPISTDESEKKTGDLSAERSILRAISELPWGEFFINFLSNLLSAALLGFVLYIAITQPRERKRRKQRQLQLLGMLYGELLTNFERVNRVIELLEPIEDVDSKPLLEKLRTRKFSDVTKEEAKYLGNELPLKYTRGIWNALKEDSFITQLDDDSILTFYLIRTNEAIVVADTSRRNLRTELLKGTTDIDGAVTRALADSKNLRRALDAVLPLLAKMDLPIFPVGDIPVEESD